MADGSWITVDLEVVAALHRLVSEEVDRCVVDSALLCFVLEVLQAVPLVPAIGKDVEGDLSTN